MVAFINTPPAFLLYFLDNLPSINLPFSLVLLLGCSSCSWCHHRICSVWSFGQADAHDADTCRRLHPAVLLPATQGTPLHYLHIPHLQRSGGSWLFLRVSDRMTGLTIYLLHFSRMNVYNFHILFALLLICGFYFGVEALNELSII